MYGLEYFLFFGVPENKIELINGKSRWSFPFGTRDEAEAHFHAWLETICRWKQLAGKPVITKSSKSWKATVAAMEMELFPRPISLKIPIAHEAFRAFHATFMRRDFWPGQPEGLETGWDCLLDRGDIRLNLWKLFGDWCSRHAGQHSSRTDIAISDTAAVCPSAYYYRAGRENIMIDGDYFCAPPDVIAEVLCASSRDLDRGPRMEVYRRAGVPHLWLIDPALETIDVYRLRDRYELQGSFCAGDEFAIDLFPEDRVRVDDLFDTQAKRWPDERSSDAEPEPIPDWILPEKFPVGLEYFFHLGHPEHRWEFWDNRARSMLAFGSADEARARLAHFVREACQWEGMPVGKADSMSADIDAAEIGRFRLSRQGRLVSLDIAVDARRYKDLLKIWGKRDVWEWGDEAE